MKSFSTKKCMGYSLFSDELTNLPNRDGMIVNTINQYSYCVAENDDEFRKSLLKSDVLLPDGIGMVWASKFLNGKSIKKIAGADLHEFLLRQLNLRGGSVFYMGSSETTLNKIESRIRREYPKIMVETYSPPFKAVFSQQDNERICAAVNAFSPDVLFLGLTAPKQEKWSNAQRDRLHAGMICSIGAVFDFYAGTIERPSKIWIDSGLEWFGRLIKEPKRMWKRYIYYGGVFAYHLFRKKIAQRTAES